MMISLNEIFDAYGRKARLFPAFLAAAPIIAVAATTTELLKVSYDHLVWAVVVAGVMYFLADFARRKGKLVEKRLVREWGGYPSKIMLRHSDQTVDPHTKRRYHEKAQTLVSGITMPSELDETSDPTDADLRYESVVRYLLANTRDQSRFGLLLKENIAYGFRRNMYGLKPIALCILVISLSYVCLLSSNQLLTGQLPEPPERYLIFGFVAGILFWLTLVTPNSVKEAAEEYGRQLLTSLDVL